MKVNREIRASKVRLINHEGEQVGVVSIQEAIAMADAVALDLVEVVPGSSPPVCKIMNYGKFRYDQTKREKENKKGRQQIKVKEIKVKPNIDKHDLETKVRHAKDFVSKGNKVKISCVFRGREMAHPEFGQEVLKNFCDALEDVATVESEPKLLGRMMTVVVVPGGKKKKVGSES